jgi:hypothetical protein
MTREQLDVLLYEPNLLHDKAQKVTDEERFLKLIDILPQYSKGENTLYEEIIKVIRRIFLDQL